MVTGKFDDFVAISLLSSSELVWSNDSFVRWNLLFDIFIHNDDNSKLVCNLLKLYVLACMLDLKPKS